MKCVLEALQISDAKSQAVFVFVLSVFMKKSIIVALGMAASVVPSLSFATLTIIFIFPCTRIFLFYGSSLHSINKYFSALYGGKIGMNKGFKRNYLGHVLVDEKLNMTWQLLAAQKADSILDSVKGSIACREGR